jgi:hypothetical protein
MKYLHFYSLVFNKKRDTNKNNTKAKQLLHWSSAPVTFLVVHKASFTCRIYLDKTNFLKLSNLTTMHSKVWSLYLNLSFQSSNSKIFFTFFLCAELLYTNMIKCKLKETTYQNRTEVTDKIIKIEQRWFNHLKV